MNSLPPVEHFRSSSAVDIYRLPMLLFPNGFSGFAYILEGAGPLTLVDTGSGMGRSNEDLLDGFAQVRARFGKGYRLSDIERIIITHGHIDHFGNIISSIGRFEWLDAAKLQLEPLWAPAPPKILAAARAQVRLAGQTVRGIAQAYHEAPLGALLAQIDSNGFLEIAVRQGNAAAQLQVELGDPVQLRF